MCADTNVGVTCIAGFPTGKVQASDRINQGLLELGPLDVESSEGRAPGVPIYSDPFNQGLV